MQDDATLAPSFVIKPAELSALNYLPPDHPWPLLVEWINRGTNQKLRATTIDMLLRTLFRDVLSPSVVQLHRTAGLRAVFRTEKERSDFASAFSLAQDRETSNRRFLVTALFNDLPSAEHAMDQLAQAGTPERSIALLWRAGQFLDTDIKWCEGHSKLSVAGAVAGGGIAAAVLGVAILAVPGVAPVAAAGAVAASAVSSVAGVSAAIGSAGGAMARMLTDHDVEGVSETYFRQQVRRGKVFVAVDMRVAEGCRDVVKQVLAGNGGQISPYA